MNEMQSIPVISAPNNYTQYIKKRNTKIFLNNLCHF